MDYYMYPVDPVRVQENEEWFFEYTVERGEAFDAWEREKNTLPDDPREHFTLAYPHHYVDVINPYLEVVYGISPYTWFAGEPVDFSEYYSLKSPDEVRALAATLSRPVENVREKLLGLPLDNLHLVETFVPGEGYEAGGTTEPGTVDQFWELMESLHAELRTFYGRAADNGQAMIGVFS